MSPPHTAACEEPYSVVVRQYHKSALRVNNFFNMDSYYSGDGPFAELRGMVFVVSVSTGLFTGIPSTKKPYRAAPDG